MRQEELDHRALDLIIDGNDISKYVGDWFDSDETLADWIIHTELVCNKVTGDVLRPLNNSNVLVKYRLRFGEVPGPWCNGSAVITWRVTEGGNEELILHGIGRLDKEKSTDSGTNAPVTAKVTVTTLVGGKAIRQEEDVATATFHKDPEQKAIMEEQLRLAAESEIHAITSPEFVLFLANSAMNSYRLLHHEGGMRNSSQFFYASLIFLPLAIEYFLKYLILNRLGTLKKEHKDHKLLKLFDFLPFELQGAIIEEFKNELQSIGREKHFQDLRVFLARTQNAFTAIRYLYELGHAQRSRHLLSPDNVAALTCVANALERVSMES